MVKELTEAAYYTDLLDLARNADHKSQATELCNNCLDGVKTGMITAEQRDYIWDLLTNNKNFPYLSDGKS